MSASHFLLAFALSPTLLVAQLTNNTVTATASQSASNTPDQAVISLTVFSGAGATLEQIVNALSGVGVTAANLSSVYGSNTKPQWNFQLIAPLAQLESTTAALFSLQKTISQNNSGLSLSFYVSGTQFSGQAPANCNFAALLAQARTQAQQIAGAAGLQTGAVTALSASTTACSLTASFAVPSPFAQPGPNIIGIVASATSAPQNDQAVIYLAVYSPVTADLSDVTNVLTSNGITGASLSGVSINYIYPIGQQPVAQLSWQFTLTVPLSKLTATITQISAAGQAIANQNSGLTLNFLNAYASASQTQQSSACSQSTLVNSAQALAQQIATAAGVSVGPVVNISQAGLGTTASLSEIVGYPYLLAPPSLPSFSCSLTVQYQLK
ncbi:MAG TPA: SIMPL domain-containing protein [Bryobacteraceae bacterium]|nr:SIMPL domain-containing protein [Bryobacteraceae bacterium]